MRVNLKTPFLTVRGVVLPDDHAPGDVIADAFERFDLPRVDGDGEPIAYSLIHVNGSRILPVGQSLSESGVTDGDTLRLTYYIEVEHLARDPYRAEPVPPSREETAEGHSVRVVLSVLDLNREELVTLPRDALVGEIIRSVVARRGLPSRDKLGQLRNYQLRSKALGRFLMDSETLAQAGVPELDRLVLCGEELAGGPGLLPFLPERRGATAGGSRLRALLRRAAARLRRVGGGARYDPVDFTVYAPPAIPEGRACLVQVFVYHPEEVLTVGGLAREFDPDATRHGRKSLQTKVARGSKLTLHLSLPGVRVDEPIQSVVWHGHLESAQFTVAAPEGSKLRDVVGTVVVSYDQIPLGHIKFRLTVAAPEQSASVPEPTGAGYAYRKAFVSYASEDRPEVLKRVQMLRLLRIKTFQDVLSLEPGARWERELYRHIDESDLFLLFWSGAARRSEWVLKEVQYALRKKGGDDLAPPEIFPIPIEGPPPVPAPEELAHLHFDDYYLYFQGVR